MSETHYIPDTSNECSTYSISLDLQGIIVRISIIFKLRPSAILRNSTENSIMSKAGCLWRAIWGQTLNARMKNLEMVNAWLRFTRGNIMINENDMLGKFNLAVVYKMTRSKEMLDGDIKVRKSDMTIRKQAWVYLWLWGWWENNLVMLKITHVTWISWVTIFLYSRALAT